MFRMQERSKDMEKVEVIKKLKALKDRGIGGEKENAAKLLEKLMKKYNITEEEIKNEETKIVWVNLRNKAEERICSQILYAYFDNADLRQRYKDRTKCFVELTAAQEIEFKYMLSIYLESFYKEQDVFISAFIQKNKIFPANGKVVNTSELSQEEKERALKAAILAEGNILF